ncbi:basic helix-loop-helix (bHLH) DNA-binding superfamily protein [Rhynchospora pubera]|uniref:Basic helix-loop-helix (BHLH) DNA-binding superfamily protein n=1 Tax=Rhynchospora pubera TaxID=906938 RepID=A0AAV8F813_9POAL|nr:basic helix-loop-helix (bHLH) DNA-binding superfamily protein [Rhynchospora pubera]KAJ4787725.1 basic helix-loop-helix (bHLH) DNA-binding superfamily protein [Rhynchospora pubera]
MQRDLKNISDKAPVFSNFETGGYVQGAALTGSCTYSIPISANTMNPNVGDHFARLEFELYEKCPQNFIILDQTNVKHRVMYNPVLIQNFGFEKLYSTLHNVEGEGLSRLCNSPSFKEDTNEIDILLNSDEGDECDDDTVSTGRSPGNWNSTSSISNSYDSSCNELIRNECKRERMRQIVRILQEIVPGAEGLDTSAVLDEAVKYLKYLKMEVENLGISSFDPGVP